MDVGGKFWELPLPTGDKLRSDPLTRSHNLIGPERHAHSRIKLS